MENKFEQEVGKGVEDLNKPWFSDHYWHVPVRWGNSEVTISNFPESGIPVFDKDHPVYDANGYEKPRFTIEAVDAIKFLKEHSKDYENYNELNWNDFIDKKNNTNHEEKFDIIETAKKLSQDKPGDNE